MQYLILPGDGDTSCDKLVVEVVVRGVQVHPFDGGELFDVQNIFAVDRPWLRERQDSFQETQARGLSLSWLHGGIGAPMRTVSHRGHSCPTRSQSFYTSHKRPTCDVKLNARGLQQQCNYGPLCVCVCL